MESLLDPAVTLFSFRRAGELLAVAALRRLDAGHAELKSMHTPKLRAGAGSAGRWSSTCWRSPRARL